MRSALNRLLKLRGIIVDMHSTILKPAPFSPGMRPGKDGSLYEFCVDVYAPGGVAECQDGWNAALPARASLARLIFCGTSDIGTLNRWFHVWAYRDAAHRDEVHARVRWDVEPHLEIASSGALPRAAGQVLASQLIF